MLKKGKLSDKAVSIIGPSSGKTFKIQRLLLSNTSGQDRIVSLFVVDSDGQDPTKFNLIPPATELSIMIPFLDIVDPGQHVSLSSPSIIQGQADLDQAVEYLIEYETL